MASSKSVVQAQNILLCQLCETDPNIKWKCVECQLLMCTKCHDRIHPKFKNAEDHHVIDLKEVRLQGEGVGQTLDFTSIRCKHHKGQICCLFCNSCNKPACPSCVSKSHNGHKFTEINEAYNLKIEHLKKGKGKLGKDKDDLTKGVQELDNLKTRVDLKCKAVVHDIQDQRAILKQEVDFNADNLIKDVEEKLDKIKDSISSEKMKVEKTLKHLEDQNKMAESLIDTTDVSKFFDEVDQLDQMLEQVIPAVNLTQKSTPNFVPGDKSSTAVGLLRDKVKIGQKLEQVIPPVNLTQKSTPNCVPEEKSSTAVGLLQDKVKGQDNTAFETFYHRSGREFQCMYLNGMRFYLDSLVSKEWQPFPKRWYQEGLLITNAVVKAAEHEQLKNREAAASRKREDQSLGSGSGDDREGVIKHPRKGKIRTYIFQRNHNIHCFYDHDTGQWMRMPIGYELHHEMVVKIVDQVEKALPLWNDRHDILALLRQCNYDADECINTYLHLEGDEWLIAPNTSKEGKALKKNLKN